MSIIVGGRVWVQASRSNSTVHRSFLPVRKMSTAFVCCQRDRATPISLSAAVPPSLGHDPQNPANRYSALAAILPE